MSSSADFLEALHSIGERVNAEMSEKDVENAFLNENFYSLLGYEGAGHDLRSEMTLPDNKRPDYITLDDTESVTTVYEFKSSGLDLDKHTDQLFHYVNELKADYGVLTNGEEFRLYSRDESLLSTIEFCSQQPPCCSKGATAGIGGRGRPDRDPPDRSRLSGRWSRGSVRLIHGKSQGSTLRRSTSAEASFLSYSCEEE